MINDGRRMLAEMRRLRLTYDVAVLLELALRFERLRAARVAIG
jgi:hypothetical protein